MTISIPTVPVSELQRSTKRVLESLQPLALIQSHGRTKGVLLSVELGERLLASGTLEALLEIPTDGSAVKSAEEFPTTPAVEAPTVHPDATALARLVGPVLSALADR